MVRQREAETSDAVHGRCPLVARGARHVAHPQIRSRGTVGGSVAHADPAAELPAVVVALDARVRAVGPGGRAHDRRPRDLYQGMLTTSLAEDEVVTAVEFPVAPPRQRLRPASRWRGARATTRSAARWRRSTVDDGVVAEAAPGSVRRRRPPAAGARRRGGADREPRADAPGVAGAAATADGRSS